RSTAAPKRCCISLNSPAPRCVMTNVTMKTAARADAAQATSAAGLLNLLFEHFDIAHASDSELQYLADSVSAIPSMAFSLAALAQGIGSLIDSDRDIGNKMPRSGALQDNDQSTVLYCIAGDLELISQMAAIAHQSNWCLRQRLIDRLKVERSCRGRTDEYSSQEGI
ncbi:hypothetical protein, partial [Caballeronia sp. GAFFF2]|uniref:hypothetical protein n=1 Tax=Caballeronia sp. GAFFF2 TaxID=2921741 RepID=UPI0020278CD3